MLGRLKVGRGAVFASLLAGCGSSAGTMSDAGQTPDTGAETEAGDAAQAESGQPTCVAYCAAIMAACNASNQQYSDMPDCMNSCLAFPVGQSGDNLVDTLGCRSAHAAMAAASAADAAIHCVHAGPGGDFICGDNCSGYCDIVMMYCTAANAAKVYDTRDQCLSDCGMRVETTSYTAGAPGRTTMGNEIGCLLYYAQMASAAPASTCLGKLAVTASTCRPP